MSTMFAMKDEEEIELLERKLEEQMKRCKERESILEERDMTRQVLEYEKAQVRKAQKKQEMEEEAARQLAMIEEEEELRRQQEAEAERQQALAELEQRMAGLTPEEREDFIRDLAEIEHLENTLEASTDALDHWQEHTRARLAQHEKHQEALRAERAVLEQEEAKARGVVDRDEEYEWDDTIREPCARVLEEFEELRREEQRERERKLKQQRRDEMRMRLSAAEQEHLESLTPQQQEEVMDELEELEMLKLKLKQSSGHRS